MLPLSPFSLASKIIVVAMIAILTSGCAIYYRDRDSGAEHVWGFGHLAMKVTPALEEKQALIQRTTLPGVAVGMDNGELAMSVGWAQREHILIYEKNAAISIIRPPSNDFFHFEIGTYTLGTDQTFDTHSSQQDKEKRR